MPQYYILNQDARAQEVFNFIREHQLALEVHLNRTRFWLDTSSPAYTEFVLRFSDHCPTVDPSLDLLTGL